MCPGPAPLQGSMTMNIKPWIATCVGAACAALALTAETAEAGHQFAFSRDHRAAHYDYARVLSVEPIVRYVTVRTPVRECWEETRYYTVDRGRGSAGGTLVGAIIGGVVGHQFGSGRGNDAATVAGTLIGAAVGNNVARRNAFEDSTAYGRPVERCETRYQHREEERVDAYRVVYRYNGQKYATQMPYDPGERMRVRVDVRPTAD